MERIDFENIEIKNFNSIEQLDFNFTDGVHLILGANGVGKTSIFEAVLWAIYKITLKEKDPSTDYKGNCFVGLNFNKGQSKYRIERFFKDKIEKNNVKLYKDTIEISLRNATSTDDEILKIIGISSDIFLSVITVAQALPINFAACTPTIRKTMLEDILNFRIWGELRSNCIKYLKDLNEKRNLLGAKFNLKKEEMIKLNSQIEAYTVATDDSNDNLIKKIEYNNKQVLELTDQLTSLRNKKNTLFQDKTIKTYDIELQNLSSVKAQAENKIKENKFILDKKICPTCDRAFPEELLTRADKELNFFSDKYNKVKKLLTDNLNNKTDLQKIETRIVYLQNDIKTIRQTLDSLEKEKDKKTEKFDVTPLRERLSALVTEVNSLNGDIDSLTKDKDLATYIDSLLIPSSKFRLSVLEKYLIFINEILESIVPLILKDTNIKLVVDSKQAGLEIEIYKESKVITYKSLSGGQKRRVDIILILALQKFILESSGISTNLICIDEIFDSLDSEGMEAIISCINTLFSTTSSIYVITHNNNIKCLFDSIIKLVLVNGKTQIIN